jgi:hypothetical protein
LQVVGELSVHHKRNSSGSYHEGACDEFKSVNSKDTPRGGTAKSDEDADKIEEAFERLNAQISCMNNVGDITMANQGATKQSGQGQSGGAFPLDNLTYDLVTVLYEKSKGLEAYDKYIRDAQNDQQARQLFEQMRQQDEQCIQQLAQQLGLRARQQGGQSRP